MSNPNLTRLVNIRATYATVGPTAVHDSSLARKKKIQQRVFPFQGRGGTVLWGLKTLLRKPNHGDSSQNTRFEGVFPRIAF